MTQVHGGVDEPDSRASGGNQPGTVALRDAMRKRWPKLTDLGMYVNRNQRGGTTKSVHSDGRAWDAGCRDEAYGKGVAAFLIAYADRLGIQRIIWWRRVWTYGRGWGTYNGQSPHTDHLHIEQNWSGARYLTAAEAQRIFGGASASPDKKADDYMFIYIVNGARMYWNGQYVYDAGDTNFYNELKASGVREVGNRNAAFHNRLVDIAEGKHRAGRV